MDSDIVDRLEGLQQEIAQYKHDISRQITALYAPTPTTSKIDLKNDPRCAVQMLQNEVAELLKDSKSYTKELEGKESQLKECEELIGVIAHISHTSDLVMQLEESIGGPNLARSLSRVAAMTEALEALPAVHSTAGDGVVCKLLRQEGKLLVSRFHTRLRRLMQQCVVVERGHIFIQKELKDVVRDEGSLLDTPIALSAILDALLQLGNAEDVLRQMMLDVWLQVVRPLWRERKLLTPRVYSSNEADTAELLYESINKDSGAAGIDGNAGVCKMPFTQLLEHVGHVLTFVYTELLCSKSEAVAVAAAALQGSPKANLVGTLSATLLAMVPKTETELAHFHKSIEKPCAEFESKMGHLGWLPAAEANEEGGFLTALVRRLDDSFVEIRRRETLSRARDLVLSDYHNTMLGTGDAQDDEPASAGDVGDPKAILDNSGSFNMQALRFESCQVSLAACRLLKLIHEVMKQAKMSSPRVAETLYHSARDCLELFLAVVPSKFSSVIETVPRMGAVFYNDCIYISHNCTLMTHLYRQEISKVDPSLKDSVGFIDYIPRLRALGEQMLCGHLDEQKGALLELLARVHLSVNHEGDEAGGSAGDLSNDVAAAGALVKHAERLRGQWFNVLQDTVYTRLTSHLIESVLRGAMKPVLECDYISEKSGADVSRVFRTLQKLRTAFPEDTQSDADMRKFVMSWDKFMALTDLLEYTLSDIAEALPKKKFASFTGTEMNSLIRALFEDSSRRRAILTSILDISAAS